MDNGVELPFRDFRWAEIAVVDILCKTKQWWNIAIVEIFRIKLMQMRDIIFTFFPSLSVPFLYFLSFSLSLPSLSSLFAWQIIALHSILLYKYAIIKPHNAYGATISIWLHDNYKNMNIDVLWYKDVHCNTIHHNNLATTTTNAIRSMAHQHPH